MGCDYYLIKELCIEFLNGQSQVQEKVIEINRERMYFYEIDSDEEYNVFSQLNELPEPKIIYTKCKWKSDYVKQKYSLFFHEIESDGNVVLKISKHEKKCLRL
jgi:hypothetical protein